MPNEEILKYIKDCLSQNYTKEQIKQSLREAGWENSQVEEALLSVQTVQSSPISVSLQPQEARAINSGYISEKTEAQKVPPRSILPMAIIAGTAVIIVGIGITFWILTKDTGTSAQMAVEQTVPVKATTTEQNPQLAQQVEVKSATSSATWEMSKAVIQGVTDNDIRAALDAAKKVQNQFNKPPSTAHLTPEQEKELQKQVESILATQKALQKAQSDSSNIIINTQQPGKNIVITSAIIKNEGFIIIRDHAGPETAQENILGISQLLPAGTAKNVQIPLSEYVDGVELIAYLYKDNGDGVFDTINDKYSKNDSGWPIYYNFLVSSLRDLRFSYYSNYLQPGSPALLLREQLPGNKIKFESVSMPFDSKNLKRSFFIAIFKDANGFPGKNIGQSQQKFGSGNEVTLTGTVSNEMLYAMIFEDNGDGKLDPALDPIVRGENNLIIIVKFKVVQ